MHIESIDNDISLKRVCNYVTAKSSTNGFVKTRRERKKKQELRTLRRRQQRQEIEKTYQSKARKATDGLFYSAVCMYVSLLCVRVFV